MPQGKKVKGATGIGDAAVRAKTGKTWAQWSAILDRAGAARMSHPEMVAYLSEKHGVGPWWQQMVTVTYEQERGLRQKYQTPMGYQASASLTIVVPLSQLFEAWHDEKTRARWLGRRSILVRKATPKRSMRITWTDGRTDVDVNFYAKGRSKSQVTVGHTKLANAAQVTRMKTFWAKALGKLKGLLEG